VRDRVDIVAGRALRYGLVPGTKLDHAVGELVRLAGGEGSLLQRAIDRVERSLDVPSGHAGRHVVTVLEAALAAVDSLEVVLCGSR
jgi:hypothetical protein